MFPLASATSASSGVSSVLDGSGDTDDYAPVKSEGTSVGTYPWSQVQEWALRDNLPKYIVRIESPTNKEQRRMSLQKESTNTVLSTYVLWRSLLHDIPELAGYPVEYLRQRYREQFLTRGTELDGGDADNGKESEESSNSDKSPNITSNRSASLETLGILPYLQDYEFAAEGGICGTVYGLEGVADGTRIETSAVSKIQETLPKGYAQTSDGSVTFELGLPRSAMEGVGRKVLSTKSSSTFATFAIDMRSLQEQAEKLTLQSAVGVEDADGFLVRLGVITGIFLAGATAFSAVAHHMTVNVFWV